VWRTATVIDEPESTATVAPESTATPEPKLKRKRRRRPKPDRDDIPRFLRVLCKGGDIVEVRALNNLRFGFFDNLDMCAKAIHELNKKQKTVYVTLNPVKTREGVDNRIWSQTELERELKARGQNLEPRMNKVVTKKRIKKTDLVTYVIGQKRETKEVDSSFDKTIERYKACLTQNEDIVARRWIMIDVDAGQPTKTNSSDKEKADAREMLQAVDAYLQSLGIKAVLTDSGNGYHAYVRVDLPNDDESTKLVSSVLRSLAKRFDGKFGTAHIDIAVSNAGRITKATGTVVFKGSDTDERPVRLSRVLREEHNVISRGQLEQLCGETQETQTRTQTVPETRRCPETRDVNNLSLDLDSNKVLDVPEVKRSLAWLKQYLAYYDMTVKSQTVTESGVQVQCTCPNAREHTTGNDDAQVYVNATGALGFNCFHNSCRAKGLTGWSGLREFNNRTSSKPRFRMGASEASKQSERDELASALYDQMKAEGQTDAPSNSDDCFVYDKKDRKNEIVRGMLDQAQPLDKVAKTAKSIGVSKKALRQIANELGRDIRQVDGQWVDVKPKQSAKAIAKRMAGLPSPVPAKVGYELLRQAGFQLDENDPADRWKVARARKLAGLEVQGSANDSIWVRTKK
jgi:hypothetical protein